MATNEEEKFNEIVQRQVVSALPKIEQQNQTRIPNWLIEVLAWIKRVEMGDSALSTSCWAFNELCWPKLHGNKVKSHFVDQMTLDGKEDKSGILQAEILNNYYFPFPLLNVPPPDYILGFKSIEIYYLDAQVLEIFKCVAPKLNDIQFSISYGVEKWGPKEKDKRTAMLDCLLNNILANKIGQFQIYTNFAKFNQLFLCFIDQLDSLLIIFNDGIEVGILYKWLTDRKENEGSKQKILEIAHTEEFFHDFFVRVEQEFTNANGPVNYLINFPFGYHYELEVGEFTLENEKTGEVLVSYQKQFDGQNVQLFLRCPKGEEERWKEEGEKKLARNRNKDATVLNVDIVNFGTFNNMV